eukprot:6483462-Amphidinium_carterae.1
MKVVANRFCRSKSINHYTIRKQWHSKWMEDAGTDAPISRSSTSLFSKVARGIACTCLCHLKKCSLTCPRRT